MSTQSRRILRWALPLAILLLLAMVAAAVVARSGNDNNDVANDEPTHETDEGEMVRSPLQIESLEVILMESSPPQVDVQVVAIIPDGCTKALEPKVSRVDNTFQVEILGERPADMMCTQVVEFHEETIALGPVDPGEYTVDVNGLTVTFRAD